MSNHLPKYVIISADVAVDSKYPGCDELELTLTANSSLHFLCLYETNGKEPIRFVGDDCAESEDQTLHRHWQWAVDEMNKLGEENEALKRELANLKASPTQVTK